MRVGLHFIWAVLVVLTVEAVPAHAQPATPPAATTYSVFLRGQPAGTETVTVRTDATGTTITSENRLAAPLNTTLRSGEIRYAPDWTPISFAADGSFNNADVQLRTTFSNGTATTQGTQGGNPIAATQPVSRQVVVLVNFMFGSYAGLARRLATDLPGTEIAAYVLPQVQIPIRVTSVTSEQAQVATQVFPVRRYELTLVQPTGDLPITLVATTSGDLVRMSVPSQSLELVRSDLASPNSRLDVFSNPGDEALVIPSAGGFNLGATITHPRTGAAAKVPAVVLLAGSGVNDRDGVAYGVPTLGQLAGALAQAGFLAVRYDKRGFGQSGGRSESASLADFAEDARTVVKWLAARKDVDPKRIAVVGHSEGAMVALLAAAREKRIAAVVSIAGPGTTGAELILEQQQAALAAANTPPAERDQKVALQKRIQQAVITGKGWEGIPPAMRKDADTPWFQSLLTYDPAKVLDDIRQPILIVHGQLDKQVPVAHADKLAALARQESKAPISEVIVRGVNHLLAPAVTGELSEYATLTDRSVSKDVTDAITGWLTGVFAGLK